MAYASRNAIFYQPSANTRPWAVEFRGVITHEWRFEGSISVYHDSIEGLCTVYDFETFELERALETFMECFGMLCKSTKYMTATKRDKRLLRAFLSRMLYN